MKVNEIFKSIQGEGSYAGIPVLFIRLSGCTRKCSFCDTKYHLEGKDMTVQQVVSQIEKSGTNTVVWTGGEPTLQFEEILQVIDKLIVKDHKFIGHHLETNGDILVDYRPFDYVCFSPKELTVAKNCFVFQDVAKKVFEDTNFDIKIVTDLNINKELIPYASILMPLTVDNNGPLDKQIEQKLWTYCVENNYHFGLRQHVKVWEGKKGV